MAKRSKVYPKYKGRYRVTTWPTYDQSLVGRGNLTLWFLPVAMAAWAP